MVNSTGDLIMTPKNNSVADATKHAHAVDLEQMLPSLDTLVNDVVEAALSTSSLQRALAVGMENIASVLRAVPVAEGRLLERGIGLIAKRNPDLVALTENLRLPVTKAATELVAMNDEALIKSLSLDADSAGRKSYTPDLLIINRATKVAHMIDVKRSLGSYELSRIAELKNRMLAAALVVPDLLYKEHRRLHVDEVRVVILNAENQRTDIDGGVWPLTHLDHLLDIAGAGAVMAQLRDLLQRRVAANWSAALRSHSAGTNNEPDGAAGEIEIPGHMASHDDGVDALAGSARLPVSFGFAKA
ncbi:MAG: hypothetical protein QE284_15965, partial [Rhizobium sp.]|nr:hypothetical protein [Rhizobium sp.]